MPFTFFSFLLAAQGFMLARQALCQLSHSTISPLPFFCIGYFRDKVSQTICLGWLQIVILLLPE
jgi:hypothetical protein